MQFRIDYHFHPNLSRSNKRALKKCKRWWEECREKKINVLVCTEHCYKKPERAFKLMEQTKPEGFFLFPGLEYSSKESAELLMFSNNSEIYNNGDLKTYKLLFEEAIDFAEKHNFVSYIAHPYALGYGGIIKMMGMDKYKEISNKLGCVEVVNTALNKAYRIINGPMKYVLPRKAAWLKKMRELPVEDYPKNAKLLTAGSDAHHIGDLGTYVEITATPETLFENMRRNTHPKIVQRPDNKIGYKLMFQRFLTSFEEIWDKHKLRLFSS
jgi:hypothetical protein